MSDDEWTDLADRLEHEGSHTEDEWVIRREAAAEIRRLREAVAILTQAAFRHGELDAIAASLISLSEGDD